MIFSTPEYLHIIFKTIVDVTDLESEDLKTVDTSEPVLTSGDVSLEKDRNPKVIKSN